MLVRVAAAGVDRGTWHLAVGLPLMARLALGIRRPRHRTPGRDLAGRVVAVGSGVDDVGVGDTVIGTADGSFAELALVPRRRLAPWPAGLDAGEAAAVPVSGLTAFQAVRRSGVAPGHRVLVVGASGGVGTFAVQLAVAAGARVTGMCGPAKVDLVRSLGAEHVLDHTAQDVDAEGVRYDVVLDIGGRRSLRTRRRVLAPRGTLVVSACSARARCSAAVRPWASASARAALSPAAASAAVCSASSRAVSAAAAATRAAAASARATSVAAVT